MSPFSFMILLIWILSLCLLVILAKGLSILLSILEGLFPACVFSFVGGSDSESCQESRFVGSLGLHVKFPSISGSSIITPMLPWVSLVSVVMCLFSVAAGYRHTD